MLEAALARKKVGNFILDVIRSILSSIQSYKVKSFSKSRKKDIALKFFQYRLKQDPFSYESTKI